MAHSGVLHIFERPLSPPNVAGPGVTYSPYPSLSTGLVEWKLRLIQTFL